MTAEKRTTDYTLVDEVNIKRFLKIHPGSIIRAISKSLKLEVGRLTIRSLLPSNPSEKWTRAKAVPVGWRGEERKGEESMRDINMLEATRLGDLLFVMYEREGITSGDIYILSDSVVLFSEKENGARGRIGLEEERMSSVLNEFAV